MMDMMGGMGLLVLAAVVLLAVVVGVAIYLGIRTGARELPCGEDAREVLRKRLARGEIAPEEYYESESALREPVRQRGGR